MLTPSPGKLRALQACATPGGIFTILAVDYRDSMRVLIAPLAPRSVASETLTSLKLAIVMFPGLCFRRVMSSKLLSNSFELLARPAAPAS